MTEVTQLATTPKYYRINIPDNTGTGDTILNLLKSAGMAGDLARFIMLVDNLSDGSARSAVVLASPRDGAAIATTDFSTHGRYVAEGVQWYAPSDRAGNVYIRSASSSSVYAIVAVIN